jgi:biopolymer transport protein ExbB/TolQ
MTLLALVEGFLFQVANALLYPVMLSVAALSVYVVWLFGVLVADATKRRGGGSPRLASYRDALAREAANGLPHLDARLERLLQQQELALATALDQVRFVIKVGPSLGLMATLIPMGIALAALAEGDIPKMAGSMVTAFTATVVGLGAGTVAYLIALKREKWVRADLREMEFATELALREPGRAEAP